MFYRITVLNANSVDRNQIPCFANVPFYGTPSSYFTFSALSIKGTGWHLMTEIFLMKICYFCCKDRVWELVLTASMRRY